MDYGKGDSKYTDNGDGDDHAHCCNFGADNVLMMVRVLTTTMPVPYTIPVGKPIGLTSTTLCYMVTNNVLRTHNHATHPKTNPTAMATTINA